MNHRRYQKEIVATEYCTKRMMEATKGICQKSIKGGQRSVQFLMVGLTPRRRHKLLWKLVPN